MMPVLIFKISLLSFAGTCEFSSWYGAIETPLFASVPTYDLPVKFFAATSAATDLIEAPIYLTTDVNRIDLPAVRSPYPSESTQIVSDFLLFSEAAA